MHTTLTARWLATHDALIEFPVIEVDEEGRIAQIATDSSALTEETSTLASTLVDVHMHGACGIDVMNAEAAQFSHLQSHLVRHGVAHFLPTTVTAPLDFTFRALERIAKFIRAEHTAAIPLGIHIEGPFLSHTKRGMHPADSLQAPSIELFDRLQQAADGQIRMMTIAPEDNAGPYVDSAFERTSALELIRYASGKGVACSIGHSNATAEEALAAIDAGAISATHTFNAMRPLDHREPGILGVVLANDRLYADLICDGIHVSPAAVQLWWRCKGLERAILITDALAAAGMADGEYRTGDDWITVDHGRALVSRDLNHGKETLAGSVLALDQAVTHFVDFTRASIADGVRLASFNPAAMLQNSGTVRIEAGAFANLTRWSADGKLVATYMRGREVSQ